MSIRWTPTGFTLVLVLLVCVLLAGQAAAGALVPVTDSTGTVRAVGSSTFAYLSGFRIFAARVLWNRFEPLFHVYYQEGALKNQVYALPMIHLIVSLDPQFDQPYYVGPWIIAEHGDVKTALDLARQGVENNPDSGLLRASYAQMLLLYAKDPAAAAYQANEALKPGTYWRDAWEQHDAYQILRIIYDKAGQPAMSAYVKQQVEKLKSVIGTAKPPGSHEE